MRLGLAVCHKRLCILFFSTLSAQQKGRSAVLARPFPFKWWKQQDQGCSKSFLPEVLAKAPFKKTLRPSLVYQGRILAVWILTPELPHSDLKIAVDFWVDFFLLLFSREKGTEKIHQKIPGKIHLGLCSEKFPSDFCRSLLLIVEGGNLGFEVCKLESRRFAFDLGFRLELRVWN